MAATAAGLTIFAVRKFFIILIAREAHLIFPTPTATAVTIRNMHQAANSGSSVPKRKMRVLSLAFVSAVILRVLSQYAIGILWVRPPSAVPERHESNACVPGLASIHLVSRPGPI